MRPKKLPNDRIRKVRVRPNPIKGVISHSSHSVLVRVTGDLIARNDVNRKSETVASRYEGEVATGVWPPTSHARVSRMAAKSIVGSFTEYVL